MRKIYKYDLYQIIKEEVNLDPKRFMLTESIDEEREITKVTLLSSELIFMFRNNPISWDRFQIRYSWYSPTFLLCDWKPISGTYLPYADAIKMFIDWLRENVKPFIEDDECVDPWKNFQF